MSQITAPPDTSAPDEIAPGPPEARPSGTDTTTAGERPIVAAASGPALTGQQDAAALPKPEAVLKLEHLSCYYGAFRAVRDVNVEIPTHVITSLIGPSGSGKSTILRVINRMNDLVPGSRVEGRILYKGTDLYAPRVDAVEVRRRIGMVFQKPNPFPKSIYENVAFGPRINGFRGDLDELVEASLRRAALWDEVKDKLKQSGMALSGGQQQRLCIARAIAVSPDVILMDEPCSALDPRATLQIEELMHELEEEYTIVIVTHNMQQAARASDYTIFLNMGEDRAGYVVETGPTGQIFTNPQDQMTEDYVSGRFG